MGNRKRMGGGIKNKINKINEWLNE